MPDINEIPSDSPLIYEFLEEIREGYANKFSEDIIKYCCKKNYINSVSFRKNAMRRPICCADITVTGQYFLRDYKTS